MPNHGGCFLAFNPDLSPSQEPALWSPQATALTVILDAAPSGFPALTHPDIERAVSIEIDISTADGRHLVVDTEGSRHRLWIKSDDRRASLGYLVIADVHFDTRKAAAERFYDRLTGRTSSRPSARLHPGPSERWRLIQWLRLLDALDQGASAREQAATLIAQDARRISAAEWDISPERKRIARWTEKAVAMRDGGFRELLLGH